MNDGRGAEVVASEKALIVLLGIDLFPVRTKFTL